MTATYGVADIKADLCIAGDEVCVEASLCDECDESICPNHSTDFVECAGNPNTLHHDECRFDCVECVGAGAEDSLAGA